jgi:hypothetical protein
MAEGAVTRAVDEAPEAGTLSAAETAATILGVIAAAVVAAGALLIVFFAPARGPVTIGWATVGGVFALLAVGLVRQWAFAGVTALVLGAAGLVLGVFGLLGVGDSVYDRVLQAPDLIFPFVIISVAGMLLAAGLAWVPPRGRVGRRVAAVVAVVGVVLSGLGVAWLLEVHSPTNATPGAANATWDCGSAYSPGSTSSYPGSGCPEALDAARTGGRSALSIGLTLVVVGVVGLATQVGWRRSWPFVCLAAAVLCVGVVAWFVALPLDGGRCGSVFSGSEGDACASMAGAIRRMTTTFAAAVPLFLVAGVAGTVLRVVRRRRQVRA